MKAEIRQLDSGFTVEYSWVNAESGEAEWHNAAFTTIEEALEDISEFYAGEGEWQ